jgi:hypothetical protein
MAGDGILEMEWRRGVNFMTKRVRVSIWSLERRGVNFITKRVRVSIWSLERRGFQSFGVKALTSANADNARIWDDFGRGQGHSLTVSLQLAAGWAMKLRRQ